MGIRLAFVILTLAMSGGAVAQRGPAPDWAAAEAELAARFQDLVRFDTTDPPGGERPAVD